MVNVSMVHASASHHILVLIARYSAVQTSVLTMAIATMELAIVRMVQLVTIVPYLHALEIASPVEFV